MFTILRFLLLILLIVAVPLPAGAAQPRANSKLLVGSVRSSSQQSEDPDFNHFYLNKRGHLRLDVWEIWKGELRRTLRAPLLRREWHMIA